MAALRVPYMEEMSEAIKPIFNIKKKLFNSVVIFLSFPVIDIKQFRSEF